jgi:hypothetical protein
MPIVLTTLQLDEINKRVNPSDGSQPNYASK